MSEQQHHQQLALARQHQEQLLRQLCVSQRPSSRDHSAANTPHSSRASSSTDEDEQQQQQLGEEEEQQQQQQQQDDDDDDDEQLPKERAAGELAAGRQLGGHADQQQEEEQQARLSAGSSSPSAGAKSQQLIAQNYSTKFEPPSAPLMFVGGGGRDQAAGPAQRPSGGAKQLQPPQPPQHNLSQSQSQSQSQNQSQSQQANQRLQHQAGSFGDQVKHVDLFGFRIVALIINDKDRLCLAQISNTLLKDFSYNEIHNRRVALGITCVQCTPIQLELLRRAGAMPSSSRRCGMITMREAERLCRSFLAEEQPPELPENFYFTVAHKINYGCKGRFVPGRYISSRAKCIECFYCGEFYSPNKFIFHSHKQPFAQDCNPPDSPNINSWRKHIDLDWAQEHNQEIKYAWEDVKSLFNGGTRRRAPPPPSQGIERPASGPLQRSRAARGSLGPAGLLLGTASPTRLEEAEEEAEEEEEGEEKMEQQVEGSKSRQTRSRLRGGSRSSSSSPPPVDQAAGRFQRAAAASGSSCTLSAGDRRKLPLAWPGSGLDRSLGARKRPLASGGGAALHLADDAPKRFAQTTGKQMEIQQQQIHQQQRTTNCNLFEQNNNQPAPLGRAQNLQQSHQGLGPNYHPQQVSLLHFQRPQAAACFGAPAQEAPRKHLQQAQSGQDGSNQASFIYNQLYSQLIQSQQPEAAAAPAIMAQAPNTQPLARQPAQGQQAHLGALENQLALRQQIWSSLLANLQQQQQQHNSHATTQLGGLLQANPVGQPPAYGVNLLDSAGQELADGTQLAEGQPTGSQQQQQQQTGQATGAGSTAAASAAAAAATVAAAAAMQNFNLFPMQLYSPRPIFGDHQHERA